jgi:uncharacterized protein (DUF2237 family)/uncharacterized membrane protein
MTEIPDFWRAEVWHPLSVHFPLAILLLGSLFLLLAYLLKREFWEKMAHVLIVIGTLGCWAAIYTGDLAESIVSRKICDPTVLKTHETNAYVAVWLFSIASALILISNFSGGKNVKNLLKITTITLSLMGSGFLIYTGHLGATLVYQQAAGVHIPSEDCSEFVEKGGDSDAGDRAVSSGELTANHRNPSVVTKADTLKIKTMKNVFGEPLQSCCTDPLTGYFRDGYCKTDATDRGTHTVCAVVTKAFLEFSKSRGNDLMTPRPEYQFPGLKPGDKWCLCALRWKEAMEAGVAPKVVLEATNEKTLEYIDLSDLVKYAEK